MSNRFLQSDASLVKEPGCRSLAIRLKITNRQPDNHSPAQLLGGRDFESAEVTFCAWSNPEGHSARRISEFQITHNETGLAGAIHIQPGLGPFDSDAVVGPHPRLQVHVTLILSRRLLARLCEIEIWVCAVLRGMISADLVVCASVGRTQVDVLEPVVLQAEGDSNKASCCAGGALSGTSREFYLDFSIMKRGVFYHRIGFTVGDHAVFGDLYRPLAEVVHGFQFHFVRSQLTHCLGARQGCRGDRSQEG